MSAANASPLRSVLSHLAAAAALTCGLAAGVALAAPQDALAAVTKLGRPAIASVKINSNSVIVKLKKVKHAKSYMLYATTKGGDGRYYSVPYIVGKNGTVKITDFVEGKTYQLEASAFCYPNGTMLRSNSKVKRVKIKPVEHKITYRLDGGTLSKGALTSYKSSSSAIALPEPTKDGYIFCGWRGSYKVDVDNDQKGDGFYDYVRTNTFWEIPEGFGQDLKLYAQWREETEYDHPWLNEETLPGSEKLAALDKRDRARFYKELSVYFKQDSGSWGDCVYEVTRVDDVESGSEIHVLVSSPWDVQTYGYIATVGDGSVKFRLCRHPSTHPARVYRDLLVWNSASPWTLSETESTPLILTCKEGYELSYNPVTCTWVEYDGGSLGEDKQSWYSSNVVRKYGDSWYTNVPVMMEHCDDCGAAVKVVPAVTSPQHDGGECLGSSWRFYALGGARHLKNEDVIDFDEKRWLDPSILASDPSACAYVPTGL